MDPFIYLNYAATSFKKPKEVIEQTTNYLMQNCDHTYHRGLATKHGDLFYQGRKQIASFFNAYQTQEVIFTPNITTSLNMVLQGLLQKGDEVLTTKMEHNAVMRPLYALEKKGVVIRYLPCDSSGQLTLTDLKPYVNKHTKVLVMTHASNVLGTVLPIQSLFSQAHNLGLITILDTAQTAGFLPIDIQQMAIDILAFTGHKSLYGLSGIGGFIIKEEIAKQCHPILSGGTGSLSERLEQPDLLPDKFEVGTPNTLGVVSLIASLHWLQQTTLSAIYEKEMTLTRYFYQALRTLPVHILGSNEFTLKVPVLSFVPHHMDPTELATNLYDEKKIITRSGLHCAPKAHELANTLKTGAIRFSFGYETTMKEIDCAIEALQEILKNK